MFHARSINRSPVERYRASTVPRLSGVIRSRTNVSPRAVLEIQDRDALARHPNVLQQNGQGTLGDRPVADEQDSLAKVDHRVPPRSHGRGTGSFFGPLRAEKSACPPP